MGLCIILIGIGFCFEEFYVFVVVVGVGEGYFDDFGI